MESLSDGSERILPEGMVRTRLQNVWQMDVALHRQIQLMQKLKQLTLRNLTGRAAVAAHPPHPQQQLRQQRPQPQQQPLQPQQQPHNLPRNSANSIGTGNQKAFSLFPSCPGSTAESMVSSGLRQL